MIYNYSERMAKMNGAATREILKLLTRPEIISFAGGFPATQCLPQKEVQEIAHELLSEGKATAVLQYGTTEGFVDFRQQMIEYVKGIMLLTASVLIKPRLCWHITPMPHVLM